jgi:hypothetical protein
MAGFCPEELGEYLNAYADRAEQWKVDHIEAKACYDLEATLVWGLSLFFAIDLIDNNRHYMVFRNSAEYDPAAEQAVENLYKDWLRPADQLLARIEEMERSGYVVKWSDPFRRACRETKGVLTPDSEFFTGDSLVALRDEAIDAHREGHTVEFHELGDDF